VRLDAELERRIAEELAGPDGLTRQRSTFTRRDVIQAFCERLPAGAGVTVAEVERAADRFLASERGVALAVGERGFGRADVLRRRDGRGGAACARRACLSTPELLRLEHHRVRHRLT
jgi:hypothetical protein